MEVITEITSQHYVVFAILAIISMGIVIVITFKKIQKYKRQQYCKYHNLSMDLDKMEATLNDILRNADDIEKFVKTSQIQLIEPEIQSIRGIIQHQLGHIPRMRSYLK